MQLYQVTWYMITGNNTPWAHVVGEKAIVSGGLFDVVEGAAIDL